MNLLLPLVSLATTVAPAATQAAQPSVFDTLRSIGPIFLIIIIAYFVLIGPKRKEEKQRQAMITALGKGDKVQTIGGMLGTILEVRDDKVQVKVDESSNTKIWFTRSAIHRVVKEDDKAEK